MIDHANRSGIQFKRRAALSVRDEESRLRALEEFRKTVSLGQTMRDWANHPLYGFMREETCEKVKVLLDRIVHEPMSGEDRAFLRGQVAGLEQFFDTAEKIYRAGEDARIASRTIESPIPDPDPPIK